KDGFQIMSTPARIQTTVNLVNSGDSVLVGATPQIDTTSPFIKAPPSPLANASTNPFTIGTGSPTETGALTQSINGPLSIVGTVTLANNMSVLIDDSGDTATHAVSIQGGTVHGLSPADITTSKINFVSIYGSKGFRNSLRASGAVGRTTFNDKGVLDTVSVAAISGTFTVGGGSLS